MHFLKRILKTHFRALNFRPWRRYERSTNFEARPKVSSYCNISLTHLWQLHSDSELFVFTKFRSLSKLSTFIGCLHPASNALMCIDINCLLTSVRIHLGLGVSYHLWFCAKNPHLLQRLQCLYFSSWMCNKDRKLKTAATWLICLELFFVEATVDRAEHFIVLKIMPKLLETTLFTSTSEQMYSVRMSSTMASPIITSLQPHHSIWRSIHRMRLSAAWPICIPNWPVFTQARVTLKNIQKTSVR